MCFWKKKEKKNLVKMKKEKWPATGVTVKFFEVEPSGDIFFLLNESGEICLVTWNKVDFCAVKKKKKAWISVKCNWDSYCWTNNSNLVIAKFTDFLGLESVPPPPKKMSLFSSPARLPNFGLNQQSE